MEQGWRLCRAVSTQHLEDTSRLKSNCTNIMATQSRTPKISEAELESQKQKLQADLEFRRQKMREAMSCVQNLKEFRTKTREERNKLLQLENVALGLYDEIDKLTKKAPAEPVTDLALEALNDIIGEAKAIASADSYVDRIKIFVAAGNNPQHRDAIIVLRQLRDGLERYRELSDNLLKRADTILPEAIFVAEALESHINKRSNLTDAEIRRVVQYHSVSGSWDRIGRWLNGSGEHKSLDLEYFDQVNVSEYFSLN